MRFAKRLLMGVGAVALAAVTLNLAAPQTAHGLVAALVQVENTAANPVPNQDVDNPGRATIVNIGCQAKTSTGPFGGFLGCTLGFGTSPDATYTVPAGQRLIMEQFDGSCSAPKGTTFAQQSLLYSFGSGVPLTSFIDLSPNSNVNFPIRYYAAAGSTIQLFASTSDTTGATVCSVNVTGHLISYP